MSMNKIAIVSASRDSSFFWKDLLDGYKFSNNNIEYETELILFENNKLGLPQVYNKALERRHTFSYMVFIHNDIVVPNVKKFFTAIISAKGDLLGFAGTSAWTQYGRSPMSWFSNSQPTKTDPNNHQAGDVYHKINGHMSRSLFGGKPSAANVEAIDGLTIVFGPKVLSDDEFKFDEQFTFDFYDLDISHQAKSKNYRIDVIDGGGLIHYSIGAGIYKKEYKQAEELFRKKWNVPTFKEVDPQ